MPRRFVKKTIKVPVEDAEWFEQTYQGYGDWTWFVRAALHRFRELHEITPNDLINEAIEELGK